MRLLSDVERNNVLQSACQYLTAKSGFSLRSCKENVKVITGEEEGVYGWIAVNYLMDGFDRHDHHVEGGESNAASTFGFLDMGGASTQIAFEPSPSEQIKHADNLLEVKLQLLSGKEVRHPVFVTTWLGFGTNQARDRYVDAHIRSYLEDAGRAQDEMQVGLVPMSERPAIHIDDPCLPKSLLMSEPRHAGYTLRGTGDFAACVRQTAPLLNKEVECLDLPCLFNGVHVPAIDFSVNHFIGISEYWYSTQDVWSMGEVYDFVGFEKNAMAFCQRDWSEIMKDHRSGAKWGSTVELSRLESQCFKAAWIINVLHDGIGIPRIIDEGGEGDGKDMSEKGTIKAVEKGLLASSKPRKPPSFQSINQVGGVAISWTLGKMVLEVSKGATSGLPLLPSSSSSSSTLSTFASEWRNRLPDWSAAGMRTTLTTVPNHNTLGIISIGIIIGVTLYFFFFSPSARRRRNSFISRLSSSKGGRRNSDNIALSEEGGMSAMEMRSPLLKTVLRSSSTLGGTVSSLRVIILRLSSSLRNWRTTSSSSSSSTLSASLPISSASYDPIPLLQQPFRPRAPLRHANSSPAFLRSTTSMVNISHGNPIGAQHYLDPPDVSDRKRGAPLARVASGSSSSTRASTFISSSNVTPPPRSSSSSLSRPSSRPTTPVRSGSTLVSGLTKLAPRSTSTSPESSTTLLPSVASGGGSYYDDQDEIPRFSSSLTSRS